MHFELNELPKASLELVGLQEPFTEEETDQIIKLAKQRRLYEFMEDIDWLYPKICMRYVDALLWRVCQFLSWTCCITT